LKTPHVKNLYRYKSHVSFQVNSSAMVFLLYFKAFPKVTIGFYNDFRCHYKIRLIASGLHNSFAALRFYVLKVYIVNNIFSLLKLKRKHLNGAINPEFSLLYLGIRYRKWEKDFRGKLNFLMKLEVWYLHRLLV
jgi:hypothetical protein